MPHSQACGQGSQYMYRSVPHIRPLFATLALVKSVRGAYMRDLTFYLANTPPLPGPRLDVDTGILYYRPLQKLVRHRSAFASLVLVQKFDGQDRLTEVGHSVDSGVFQALRGFVPPMCYSIDTTRGHALRSSVNSLTGLWTLAPFWRCHSTTATLNLTV